MLSVRAHKTQPRRFKVNYRKSSFSPIIILFFETSLEEQVSDSHSKTPRAAPPISGSTLRRSAPGPHGVSPVGRVPRGVSHGVAEPRAVPAATSRVAVLLPQGCGCCCCAGIGEAEAGSWRGDVEKQYPKIQSYDFSVLRSMKPLLYSFAKPLCREEVLSRHAPPLLAPRVVGVLSRPS